VGSLNILSELEKHLGVQVGETTKDGCFTLEVASCLGVCGVAPAMMIDENIHGNLTPQSLAKILAGYA
jgi:NADH:ubiquinone oxidoreductase subunit E